MKDETTYKVTYHLAPGVQATNEKVTREDVIKIERAFEKKYTHVVVQGANGWDGRTQIIPINSILAVDIEPMEE